METTTVIDVIPGMSSQSARQEFLGCAFDLKKRIVASEEKSERLYKEVVFQISEEYQVQYPWRQSLLHVGG